MKILTPQDTSAWTFITGLCPYAMSIKILCTSPYVVLISTYVEGTQENYLNINYLCEMTLLITHKRCFGFVKDYTLDLRNFMMFRSFKICFLGCFHRSCPRLGFIFYASFLTCIMKFSQFFSTSYDQLIGIYYNRIRPNKCSCIYFFQTKSNKQNFRFKIVKNLFLVALKNCLTLTVF